MNTDKLCVFCGLYESKTKRGAIVKTFNTDGYNTHDTCRKRNQTMTDEMIIAKYGYNDNGRSERCAKASSNRSLYDIKTITYSELQKLVSDEEYNESTMPLEYTGRKLQVLIISHLGKTYYAIAGRRCAYIAKTNLTWNNIQTGAHFGVTWKGPLDEMLYYGPLKETPLSFAYGWDYNHLPFASMGPTFDESYVPIEYIYKNICDIIADAVGEI